MSVAVLPATSEKALSLVSILNNAAYRCGSWKSSDAESFFIVNDRRVLAERRLLEYIAHLEINQR